MDEVYDAIVAGAGPAGASAAYNIARNGLRVLLIDKATFPRDKMCGGAITARLSHVFPELLPAVDFRTARAVIHTRVPGNDIAIGRDGNHPIVYLVRRVVFDNELLELCKKAGVKVSEGTRVTGIDEREHEVTVHCQSGSYRGKFLVGADGCHSVVRRSTPLQQYWQEDGVSFVYEEEVEVGKDAIDRCYTPEHVAHIHFGFAGGLGYGWVFPKANHVNVGFGEFKSARRLPEVRRRYGEYVAFCKQQGFLPPEFESEHPTPWSCQVSGPMQHYATKRVLLAGEAAGFVSSIMGEGILFGLWSGKIAANAIAGAGVEDVARDYEEWCERQFGKQLRKMVGMQRILMNRFDLFVKLARWDAKMRADAIAILDGIIPLSKLTRRIAWRAFVGILKGHARRSRLSC